MQMETYGIKGSNASEKLKPDAWTQNAKSMQKMSVLSMAQLKAIPQQQNVS